MPAEPLQYRPPDRPRRRRRAWLPWLLAGVALFSLAGMSLLLALLNEPLIGGPDDPPPTGWTPFISSALAYTSAFACMLSAIALVTALVAAVRNRPRRPYYW